MVRGYNTSSLSFLHGRKKIKIFRITLPIHNRPRVNIIDYSRYFSNENPNDLKSGNNDPEIKKWEIKISCPNPDEIINDFDFWNSYLDSKNFCPNVDIELDKDHDWLFKNIVEIPDEVLSK